MSGDYLMYTASAMYIICYVPELYANWKNKNANIYNIPEKVLVLVGTTFALSYSIINKDPALLANYGPLFVLDLTAFCMRFYYVYKNWQAQPIATIELKEVCVDPQIKQNKDNTIEWRV